VIAREETIASYADTMLTDTSFDPQLNSASFKSSISIATASHNPTDETDLKLNKA
jgi:hypothetical protein